MLEALSESIKIRVRWLIRIISLKIADGCMKTIKRFRDLNLVFQV